MTEIATNEYLPISSASISNGEIHIDNSRQIVNGSGDNITIGVRTTSPEAAYGNERLAVTQIKEAVSGQLRTVDGTTHVGDEAVTLTDASNRRAVSTVGGTNGVNAPLYVDGGNVIVRKVEETTDYTYSSTVKTYTESKNTNRIDTSISFNSSAVPSASDTYTDEYDSLAVFFSDDGVDTGNIAARLDVDLGDNGITNYSISIDEAVTGGGENTKATYAETFQSVTKDISSVTDWSVTLVPNAYDQEGIYQEYDASKTAGEWLAQLTLQWEEEEVEKTRTTSTETTEYDVTLYE